MSNMGFRTLGEMRTEIQGRFQKTTSPSFNAMIDRELNNALRFASAHKTWRQFKRVNDVGIRKADVSTVSTAESGERFVPFPWNMAKVLAFTVDTPSYCSLTHIEYDEMAEIMGLARTTSGVPAYWTEWGVTAQYRLIPTTANGTLTAKSGTSDNDSASALNRTATVSYRISTDQLGEPHQETLQGTFSGSGINLTGTSQTGWPIESVTLSAGWTGNFTIEDDSGTVVVDIQGTERPDMSEAGSRTYSRILAGTWPIADTDYAGTFAWQMRPLRLVRDADAPPIPVQEFMIERATAALWRNPRRNWEAAHAHDIMARELLASAVGEQAPRRTEPSPSFPNVVDMTGMWG